MLMGWFRWHHGSVTDPKFQLVAKKASASVGEVIAVWACLLEAASASEQRGNHGAIDFESMDCSLGYDDGKCRRIYDRMCERDLIDDEGGVAAWDRRQPKRERDDDSSTDRVRAFRDRQRQEKQGNATETPRNANADHETPREEKKRVEKHSPPPPSRGEPATGGGFARFWAAWPKHPRKAGRHQCWAKWQAKGLEAIADRVVAHVEALKAGEQWRKEGGGFIPSPLVYLNQDRWEAPTEGDIAAEHWTDSQAGIRSKGVELGVGDWTEDAWARGDVPDFLAYRARVFKAAGIEPARAA